MNTVPIPDGDPAASGHLGDQLDAIMRDLDSTGAAWKAAGYPWDGPTADAREAVFARLKEWNRRASVTPSVTPSAPVVDGHRRTVRG